MQICTYECVYVCIYTRREGKQSLMRPGVAACTKTKRNEVGSARNGQRQSRIEQTKRERKCDSKMAERKKGKIESWGGREGECIGGRGMQ